MGYFNFGHYSNSLHRWDRKVAAIIEWLNCVPGEEPANNRGNNSGPFY